MGWTSIATLDAPSSNVFTFTGLSLAAYDLIEVRCAGITVTTDGTDMLLTLYVGGVEQTSGYKWTLGTQLSSGSGNGDVDAAAAAILLNSPDANWDTGNGSGEAFGGVITIPKPGETTFHKRLFFEVWQQNPSPNSAGTFGAGIMENTGAIDGLKISGTSALTAGKVRLLGYAAA